MFKVKHKNRFPQLSGKNVNKFERFFFFYKIYKKNTDRFELMNSCPLGYLKRKKSENLNITVTYYYAIVIHNKYINVPRQYFKRIYLRS